MPAVNPWAAALPTQQVREIIDLVAERPEVLRLEMGQPNFDTPDHVVDAAMRSLEGGSGYTYSAGTWTLRAAIAHRLRKERGFDLDDDQVVVTQGGVQGVSLIMSTLVRAGDEVLIPDPAWPNFEMLAGLHGATPVFYPLRPDDGFLPDPEELESLITPRTTLIIINTPSNPTGASFPDELVDALVEIAERHDVTLLADEVYDELTFDGLAPANAFARSENHVVGLYSYSKTYAMTGWRVGYVVAPRWLAPTLGRTQEPLLSCLPTFTQAGAEAATTGPHEPVERMRSAYEARRDVLVEGLRDGGIDVASPAGAFYLMFPLSPGADAWGATIDLIEQQEVALSPGTGYGTVCDEHLRVSLAADDEAIREGTSRIVQWYADTDGGLRLGTT